MEFWIFMVIMNLLIPVSMIGFGIYFRRSAPGKINPVFGYRTSRSMKNQETWNYAHQYIGRQWFVIGWILVAVTSVLMIPIMGEDADTVGLIGGCIEVAQILPMIGSVMATERELKRMFDDEGKKRQV